MTYAFEPQSLMLQGKAALVTGGGRGIGAAVAVALARAGADVAVTYNTHAPVETGEAIGAAGRHFAAIQCDFATLDPETAELIVEKTTHAFGRIDILVNNAGTIQRVASEEAKAADWRRVLDVNLDAAFYMCQAAGRRFLQQGCGRIINVASVLGFQGGLTVAAYASSKHALVGLTRALCNEWAGRGVTVNAIAPGYTVTENTKALREDPVRAQELVARIPAGRFAEPAEIAGAAVFLASDAAAYVNGHTLAIDGGWLAR